MIRSATLHSLHDATYHSLEMAGGAGGARSYTKYTALAVELRSPYCSPCHRETSTESEQNYKPHQTSWSDNDQTLPPSEPVSEGHSHLHADLDTGPVIPSAQQRLEPLVCGFFM
jgi:hypothetical protein